MVRFEEFKLSGYKNILEANLSFNNISVIIGSNNSGKSNFLQSISFINFIINTASTDDLENYFNTSFYKSHFGDIIPQRILSDESNKHLISFNLRFSNGATRRVFNYNLQIEAHESDIFEVYQIRSESLDVKEINKPGQAESVFKRDGKKVKYGTKLSRTSLLEDVPEYFSVIRVLKLVLINEGDKAYFDAVNSLNSVIKTPTFYFSNLELQKVKNDDRLSIYNGRVVAFELEDEIMKLEKSDIWEVFKQVLNDILGINDVRVRELAALVDEKTGKRHKYLIFEHFGVSKVIRQFSDGTVLIIALITKVLSSQNDIFFIEEPENSTHPRALIDLFAFIKSFSENKQFILTSHSIAILNKTKPENIIISSVDENGLSTLYNVSDKKDLRKRLKQGHINFSDELFFGDLNEDEFE